jgi:hypothetical protein
MILCSLAKTTTVWIFASRIGNVLHKTGEYGPTSSSRNESHRIYYVKN